MYRQGHIFKDTYRVEKQLSGSKHAYKVSHLSLNTPFVLECFQDLTGLEELDYQERLQLKKEFSLKQERLKTIAATHHDNLSRIVDSFEFEKSYFLVREWVEGYSLHDLVSDSLKPLTQDTAADFASQLLDLLETLGEQDPPLVLGTLCPDYIVVRPDGHLKVIDFGLSDTSKGKTEFEAFSCPELFGGHELDQRADLFSLAAVLYFSVTGAEIPPIWDRITCRDSIPSPLELEIKVDAPFWATLESMLSLNIHARPETVERVRELFQQTDTEETAESSPATWYPEQSGLLLSDSHPFSPFQSENWILKMVQAAVVGRARGLDVIQNREACSLNFRFAAPDVPSPQHVLEALSTNSPVSNPLVAELACGLRVVGEFRDFHLTLDDWKRSWTLSCEGGKIRSKTETSSGRSGVLVKVDYQNNRVERARQTAEESVCLTRKTRLCTVPITLGKKPLEPGRKTRLSELPKNHAELYLASASLPSEGSSQISGEPSKNAGRDNPFTSFQPRADKTLASHIDVRCIVAPGDGNLGKVLHLGYHFLRKKSRVLWYRRGVLCGEQFLEKELPLQLDIHINGDHLDCDKAGLTLQLPDWLQANRLKPILELSRILPLTKLKLEEFWEENPTEANTANRFTFGLLGTPIMLLFFGWSVGPGLAVLKAIGLGGLLKGSALAGGTAGALTARDHWMAVRKTCLQAIKAFEKENI